MKVLPIHLIEVGKFVLDMTLDVILEPVEPCSWFGLSFKECVAKAQWLHLNRGFDEKQSFMELAERN